MEEKLKLHGIIIESQQGGFTGYYSEFPEAIAEGETQEEVKKNMLDALIEILTYRKDNATESSSSNSTSFELNLEIA